MDNIVHDNQYCSQIAVQSHPSVAKKFAYKLVVEKDKQIPQYNQ